MCQLSVLRQFRLDLTLPIGDTRILLAKLPRSIRPLLNRQLRSILLVRSSSAAQGTIHFLRFNLTLQARFAERTAIGRKLVNTCGATMKTLPIPKLVSEFRGKENFNNKFLSIFTGGNRKRRRSSFEVNQFNRQQFGGVSPQSPKRKKQSFIKRCHKKAVLYGKTAIGVAKGNNKDSPS